MNVPKDMIQEVINRLEFEQHGVENEIRANTSKIRNLTAQQIVLKDRRKKTYELLRELKPKDKK
jgi:hypothetical protein